MLSRKAKPIYFLNKRKMQGHSSRLALAAMQHIETVLSYTKLNCRLLCRQQLTINRSGDLVKRRDKYGKNRYNLNLYNQDVSQ